jgi:GntR family transcriptional regulator, carbon starvation induced regulator
MNRPPDRELGDTLTERAIDRLHQDILSGILAPGTRLAVADLAETYGIGTTPIREALSRLVSKNLITVIGRRGFRVREMGREDLEDITRLRFIAELEGIRLSMLHGDDAWEASIIAQLHQLRVHVNRSGRDFGQGGLDFDHLHRQFHAALLAASGSPRLKDLSDNLYDQACRYRLTMMRMLVDPDEFIRMHSDLAEAVLGRDADAVAGVLREHLYTTVRCVYPEAQHDL